MSGVRVPLGLVRLLEPQGAAAAPVSRSRHCFCSTSSASPLLTVNDCLHVLLTGWGVCGRGMQRPAVIAGLA